ncbi:MAG: RNA-directed DNA polymerase [Bacteroidaceae bacterium]|nr:RNA-directed DNA polymerase [Bacteroidaceae bacterium]
MKREIFAADFRDRVVHHLIARRIYPLLEAQFITDSYSTQTGKGTLFGIQHVEQHIRDCSENYTRDCYIMKLDISGYFMSISKERLYDCIRSFLERHYKGDGLPMLLYLLRETICNRPEKNCIRKVPKDRWRGLPRNKSLFGSDGNTGLPIGNLTSQLLALLYLDELDHLITGAWGVEHYGRYVDDMVLVHPSAAHLLEVRQKIRDWLDARGLLLHPKKMYLQHYSKGVMFVGGMIKPGRKYIAHRTVGRFFAKIHRYNGLLAQEQVAPQTREAVRATVNSYLGMMCHYNSKRLFHRVLRRVTPGWYRYFYFQTCGTRCKLVARKHIDDHEKKS